MYGSADLTNGSGTFTVSGPATANLAPPGYYMLYVIDQNGIPSVSASVHVISEPLKILETRKTGTQCSTFLVHGFCQCDGADNGLASPPSDVVSHQEPRRFSRAVTR